MNDKSCGIIYIIQNPAFEEWVKIGYTNKTVQQRIEELYCSSAVPFTFKTIAYCEVFKPNADKDFHCMLDEFRPDLRAKEKSPSGRVRSREFFQLSPDDACKYLGIYARSIQSKVIRPEITTEQKQDEKLATIAKQSVRAPGTTFEMIGIPIGETIYFQNDKSKGAIVKDNKNKVEYKGKVYSYSMLAAQFLQEQGKSGAFGGSWDFFFNDKNLWELRPDQQSGE